MRDELLGLTELNLGQISHGAAAVAYTALALLLVTNLRERRIGRLLLSAALVEAVWAAVMMQAMSSGGLPAWLPSLAETARSFTWCAFIVALPLTGADDPRDRNALGTPFRQFKLRAFQLGAAVSLLALSIDRLPLPPDYGFAARLMMALIALVLVEQLYRNTAPSKRWAIKFLCLSLVAMFGFDVVMFSDALMFSRLEPEWLAARGLANVLLVPLIAISVARARHWRVDITVSRRVVVHSALLFVAGFYLVLMAAAAWILRAYGGGWGTVAQIVFAFAAGVTLAVLMASGRMRAWLRVTVAKNFFSYRYDYRQEWLTFTDAMSAQRLKGTDLDEHAELEQRVIVAIARLVESHGGALWLRDEHGEFTCRSTYKTAHDPTRWRDTDSLVVFLRDTGWIVDLDRFRTHPDEYRALRDPALGNRPANPYWLVVPLLAQDALIGVVALLHSSVPFELDWEITDLLKTAGRQAASTISQKQAFAALLQARQFESFNRMSAFVVHEVKNLVSQLDLLTANAARHQRNPEFQADMLATVQNVLEHMRKLLMQLRVGVTPVDAPIPVSVHRIVKAALAAKQGLSPPPEAALADDVESLEVCAHPDRLERVIGHLLQNAAEASTARGEIVLRTRRERDHVLIEVHDNGQGMTEEFVRQRLFRPFESDKPMGMGIGVFESREYVREIGGRLEVSSRLGAGSTFTIRLPAVTPGARPEQLAGEIARG